MSNDVFDTLAQTINYLSNGILSGDRDLASAFVRTRSNDNGAKGERTGTVAPEIRTVKGDDDVAIYFDIPGVAKESIDAEIDTKGRIVKVTAPRADGRYTYFGKVYIADCYDLDCVSTAYADGVLKVTVKRKEVRKEQTARKLEID